MITDRLDGALTNGSQVMARAVITELSRWFDLRIIVRQDKDELPPQVTHQVSLIYNFGCTAFSAACTAAVHAIDPSIPVINHFQLVLPEYARQEGYDQTDAAALGEHCRELAGLAACNIFPSFSELNRVIRLEWPIQYANNLVIRNAFVPAAGSAAVTTAPASIRFLAAGRFSDYVKGADLLYRAFSEYYTLDPGAHLYIAGDEQRFTRLLRGIPRNAWTFLGWLEREELHAWLKEADVFIIPSRYEPFGLVALEAMAMGTPVISMAIGGLAEIIHHGHTGWLSDPRQGSLGLRNAMEEAALQKDRLPQMGQLARNTVESRFSLNEMVAEIRKVIDHLIFRHELVSY
jgi:glycosyltransferase involved in cell wall biosynthesis